MTKKSLIVILLLLVAASGAFAAPDGSDNCYTVVVGRKASADGSVLVAHNEDDYGDVIVNVRKIGPRDYGAPQKVALGNGAVYETDGKTNGFLWIEAAGQEFADSFINQHGVVIASDSCPSRETKDDLTEGGVGYMLRRIVAEKAVSARDAVRIASELVERFGYTGSGRTYTFADKSEAWMMAVIKGRHWMAQRVPDDEVAVIPNHYIIHGINLGDPAKFAGSRDIVDYARANGWYDDSGDGAFDFQKAFGRPPRRPDPVFDGNTLRHWRGLTILSGKSWDIGEAYPFSFKPARKVTPEALKALLRDHYEGTEFDATDGYRTGTPNRTKYRTICTSTTINAFVVSLNAALPEPISASLWLALGKPDTTIFLPLYYGVESLPPGAGLGADVHDYPALYKQHFEDAEWRAGRDALLQTKVQALQKIAEADYGPVRRVIDRDLGPAEKDFEESRRVFEPEFLSLYLRNRPEALLRLTAWVAAAFKDAGELYDAMLKKLPEKSGTQY
jgi:dipeptidase